MIDKRGHSRYNGNYRNRTVPKEPSMQPISEEMLQRAANGDEAALAALIARMMPVIRKGAWSAQAPGLEFDDAVQEGLIGLFGAVRGYDPSRGVPFASYAANCIVNAQRDAHRAATRKKHAPLNDSVPLPEDEAAPGPEELAIASENRTDVLAQIDTLLSPLERAALLASLDGLSPAETARVLDRPPRAVENALARARRKLRAAR